MNTCRRLPTALWLSSNQQAYCIIYHIPTEQEDKTGSAMCVHRTAMCPVYKHVHWARQKCNCLNVCKHAGQQPVLSKHVHKRQQHVLSKCVHWDSNMSFPNVYTETATCPFQMCTLRQQHVPSPLDTNLPLFKHVQPILSNCGRHQDSIASGLRMCTETAACLVQVCAHARTAMCPV